MHFGTDLLSVDIKSIFWRSIHTLHRPFHLPVSPVVEESDCEDDWILKILDLCSRLTGSRFMRWQRGGWEEKYSPLNHTTLLQCQIISLCKAYKTICFSLEPAQTSSFCVSCSLSERTGDKRREGEESGVFVVMRSAALEVVCSPEEQRNVWVVCELLQRPVISLDLYRPVNKDQTWFMLNLLIKTGRGTPELKQKVLLFAWQRRKIVWN